MLCWEGVGFAVAFEGLAAQALVLVCSCLRWHPRFVSGLQALPLCGATLADQSHNADASEEAKKPTKRRRHKRNLNPAATQPPHDSASRAQPTYPHPSPCGP